MNKKEIEIIEEMEELEFFDFPLKEAGCDIINLEDQE